MITLSKHFFSLFFRQTYVLIFFVDFSYKDTFLFGYLLWKLKKKSVIFGSQFAEKSAFQLEYVFKRM